MNVPISQWVRLHAAVAFCANQPGAALRRPFHSNPNGLPCAWRGKREVAWQLGAVRPHGEPCTQ